MYVNPEALVLSQAAKDEIDERLMKAAKYMRVNIYSSAPGGVAETYPRVNRLVKAIEKVAVEAYPCTDETIQVRSEFASAVREGMILGSQLGSRAVGRQSRRKFVEIACFSLESLGTRLALGDTDLGSLVHDTGAAMARQLSPILPLELLAIERSVVTPTEAHTNELCADSFGWMAAQAMPVLVGLHLPPRSEDA